MRGTSAAAQRARRPWPVVVGGSGGSGTRLVVTILRAGGVYMGTKVNPTEDALAFRHFNQTWIRPYLKHQRRGLHNLDHSLAVQDLQEAVAEHCADLADPAQPWGWKRPESIYVLPFLHQQLPGMTFLHVVRNGLDMAFSSNQNDLLRYGIVLPGRAYDHEPEALRSIRLWTEANVSVADYGENHMGPRYLRVHFEALCAHPVETVATIFDALGLLTDPGAATASVADPGTVGRWRAHSNPKLLLRLLRVGAPALQRFGYWEESAYRELLRGVGRVPLALMPLEERAWRIRHFLSRAARAARERRLRAALRNALARWTQEARSRERDSL